MNENRKIADALKELGFQESRIPDIVSQHGIDASENKVGVYGHVRVEKHYTDGHTEVHFDDGNLITDLGFTALSQVWALNWDDTDAAFKLAAKTRVPYIIAVGTDTGGTLPLGVTNTALGAEPATARKKITSRTFSGSPVDTVLLSITFDTTELNGTTISESGIFAADGIVGTPGSGTMFTRKIFAGLPKTVNFDLTIKWSFTFAKP